MKKLRLRGGVSCPGSRADLSLFVSAIAAGQGLVCAENWVEPNFKTERGVLPIRNLVCELCSWRVSKSDH